LGSCVCLSVEPYRNLPRNLKYMEGFRSISADSTTKRPGGHDPDFQPDSTPDYAMHGSSPL